MTSSPDRADVAALPRVADRWTALHLERAKVTRYDSSVTAWTEDGAVRIPVARLSALFLGWGTSITSAAVRLTADSGTTLVWHSPGTASVWAHGRPATSTATRAIRQAEVVADDRRRVEVARAMFTLRFGSDPGDVSLAQLRGLEGQRVKQLYRTAAKVSGVPWRGRSYNPANWDDADPVNRALSTANATLHGIVHGAVAALGYVPSLGVIHTGTPLALIYDVADLYKAEFSVPAAFDAAAAGKDVERGARSRMRDLARRRRLLSRIVVDLDELFGLHAPDTEEFTLSDLWDPEGPVPGGIVQPLSKPHLDSCAEDDGVPDVPALDDEAPTAQQEET